MKLSALIPESRSAAPILCGLLIGTLLSASAQAADWTSFLKATPAGQPATHLDIGFGAPTLQLASELTTLRVGTRTLVTPQLSSKLTLPNNFHVETRLTWSDWNTDTELLKNAAETKLYFETSTPIIKRIEGTVWRNIEGNEGQRFFIGMNGKDLFTFLPPSISLQANASLEQLNIQDTWRTTATGFDAVATYHEPESTSIGQIRFHYGSVPGDANTEQSSLTISRSWQQHRLRMGAEYELSNQVQLTDNILRLSCQGNF